MNILSCEPPYVNTLPGTTGIDTPFAKSTLVTQASQYTFNSHCFISHERYTGTFL